MASGISHSGVRIISGLPPGEGTTTGHLSRDLGLLGTWEHFLKAPKSHGGSSEKHVQGQQGIQSEGRAMFNSKDQDEKGEGLPKTYILRI